MRAAVGRVDVPAEVVGLGLAGRDERADRPRARHAHHRRADAGQESAARTRLGDGVGELSAVHRRTMRRSAAARTDSSCAPVLKVPLARTVPSAASATANGLPGTSAAAHAVGVLDLVERAQAHGRVVAEGVDRGCQRAADPTAVGREHRQSEAARLGRDERQARADLRPLVGDLERAARCDGQPQHPHLAGQRQHDHRERDEAQQRRREPDRQPALGRSAPPAAGSARARAPPPAPPRGPRSACRSSPWRRSIHRARPCGPRGSRRPGPRSRPPAAARRRSRPGRCPRRRPRPARTSAPLTPAQTAYAARGSRIP